MPRHFNLQSQKSNRRRLRKEQTYTEALVWRYLRNRKLSGCKFRRQYSIDKYVIDFFAPGIKLAIEIDGDVHDQPEQKEHDLERQSYLESFGIRFIRIKNEEFFDSPNKAFGRIESAVKELHF